MSVEQERPTSMFEEQDELGGVIGYMCMVDFDCELGAAAGGNVVYPSVGDARISRKCVESCGLVEVRVVGIRVVQQPSDLSCEEQDIPK